MREIKFRAWDKNDKKMYEVNFIEFPETGRPFANNKRFGQELMQFTGLLDKSGKEIYEGDILKWNGARYWKERNIDCGEVISIDNIAYTGFAVKNDYDNINYSLNLHPGNGQAFEIIGNIFEQPELVGEAPKAETACPYCGKPKRGSGNVICPCEIKHSHENP